MVNYQSEPLGIDVEEPLFGWRMAPSRGEHGIYQSAYQIEVTNEDGMTVWNSGKVEDGRSQAIRYAGDPLQPTTRYTWTVTSWNQDDQVSFGSSWFETGLMNPDPDLPAWDGATWIGGGDDDIPLYAHYLSVFKLGFEVQLDEASQSTKAAFVFGANDDRLQDPDLNFEGTAAAPNESYLAVELDVANLRQGGQAQLYVYRSGYSAEDNPGTPLTNFPIPTRLINISNQYDSHRVLISCVFGVLEFFVDGEGEANKLFRPAGNGNSETALTVNPYGSGGNYISFPMVADIGFRMAPEQVASFSNVVVRNYRIPSNALFMENLSGTYQGIFPVTEPGLSVANGAYRLAGDTEGILITADPSRNAAPMLRTVFSAGDQPIDKARVYVTARGIYELYLNGERVSNDYFNPGLTQYNKTHFYQTYDVTDLIREGSDNALGAWLSEGWWSGNVTFSGENWNYFGDRQSLLAKLVITYEDGSTKVITSNPEEWQLFTEGPIRYGSFFQGEVYDARLETAVEDWSTPDYDASSWGSAVEVPFEGTVVNGTYQGPRGGTFSLDYGEQEIIGQVGGTVTRVETLTAQRVEEVRPGVFVYDMGQNMVGVPTIELANTGEGDTIRLRYAEVRYPNLSEHEGNIGMVMLENIRAALTQDIYISAGGPVTIQPRFTFHGYRFVEITGVDQAPPLESVRGNVLSSVEELASHYETSNELVNRLWENITWSLRGNFLSIPTDTPARNERMGWNGDINVFSRAATWLADANQFLKRHMLAMRDMQAENGRFSDVAPIGNGFGGTLWGSAGIIVAWETYQQYGDLTLLEEHYPAMQDYMDFLASRQNDDGILVEGPLGDWLSPENSKNDNTLLWTAYQVYCLDIMQQVASLLGKPDDAEVYQDQYAERKDFFNDTYVEKETGKTMHTGVPLQSFGPPPENPPRAGDIMDTQASYAIPLAFNVFKEEYKDAAVRHLAATIKRPNVDDLGVERPPYSLMTGFIGTAAMGDALSENGRDTLAYRMLQAETYPSWLYPVINGATTIWERLNSYTIEDGFGGNNSMNSFNHYAFGAIASWMYNHSLGIQRDPDQPGFKSFLLKPTPDPDGNMTFAKGYYDSPYGRIVSEWEIMDENATKYTFTVPPNTTATLFLTANDPGQITENGTPLNNAAGVTLTGQEDGKQILELLSGEYEFVVQE